MDFKFKVSDLDFKKTASYNVNKTVNKTVNKINLNNMDTNYEEIDYGDNNPLLNNTNKVVVGLVKTANLVAQVFNKTFQQNVQKNWEEYNVKMQQYYKNKFEKKYPTFYKYLKQEFIPKPHTNSEFITQGCGMAGSYALLTYYSNKKNNSIISVVDNYGISKTLNLDNNSHVGGIAYHEKSGKVFVSADGLEEGTKIVWDNGIKFEKEKGEIYIYDIEDIKNSNNGAVINNKQKITLNDSNLDRVDYLSINGDSLYAGKFSESPSAYLEKYNLDENGNIKLESTYKVPFKKVQGMATYKYKNVEYYIFSTSYGRKNDSDLIIATIGTNGEFIQQLKIGMPCMAEGISMNENNDLNIVFESDCAKYSQGTDGNGESSSQIQDICTIDIKNIISEHVEFQENMKDWKPPTLTEILENNLNNNK